MPRGVPADVDCTAAGKPLCDSNGVKGFPTIKYGDPADLQDYKGGRDLKSLKAHAEEKLVPMCSPAKLERLPRSSQGKHTPSAITRDREELYTRSVHRGSSPFRTTWTRHSRSAEPVSSSARLAARISTVGAMQRTLVDTYALTMMHRIGRIGRIGRGALFKILL